MIGLPYGKKNCDDILSRFHPIPGRYGRTDRRTEGRTELLYQYRASVCWRAIKIGQQFSELWTNIEWDVFMAHGVHTNFRNFWIHGSSNVADLSRRAEASGARTRLAANNVDIKPSQSPQILQFLTILVRLSPNITTARLYLSSVAHRELFVCCFQSAVFVSSLRCSLSCNIQRCSTRPNT